MNIIERITDILEHFPKIGELHSEIVNARPDSFALASVGDKKVSEDVIGGEVRQHTFLLSAVYSGMNDYERMANSGVLLELAVWLERQAGVSVETTVGGVTYSGTVTDITTANGMLYAVPDSLSGGLQYRLQIIAEYTMEG